MPKLKHKLSDINREGTRAWCEYCHAQVCIQTRRGGSWCRGTLPEILKCVQCGVSIEHSLDHNSRRGRKYCRECAPTHAALIRLRLYKVDQNMFDAMYFDQDGACAICKVNEATHVDHDHSCCSTKPYCGRCIRGLLCDNCNKGIGCLKENIETLYAAIDYLTKD